jgi:hypothetical protein
MTSHPNVRRQTPREPAARVLAFAPDPAVHEWIERELADRDMTIQVARTIRDIIASLVEDPPPRAQILIGDFDAMTAGEVLELHSIRVTWYGSLIALGTVDNALRASLSIEFVLPRPLVDGCLRSAVTTIGVERATTKMKTFPFA